MVENVFSSECATIFFFTVVVFLAVCWVVRVVVFDMFRADVQDFGSGVLLGRETQTHIQRRSNSATII